MSLYPILINLIICFIIGFFSITRLITYDCRYNKVHRIIYVILLTTSVGLGIQPELIKDIYTYQITSWILLSILTLNVWRVQ